jgi:excisionase family DNA binding protein
MTTKITVERINSQAIRVTLVADIHVNGDLNLLAYRAGHGKPARTAPSGAGPDSSQEGKKPEFVTVEETAEILQISRDKVYHLLRTGKLRSIKIGKLRRISRA